MKAYCTQNTDRECRKEDCCLNMTKKTKLIPFNYELYKCGMKAKFSHAVRKELEIIDIHNNANLHDYLVIFKNSHGKADNLYLDSEHLFLEQELEEKTFYVNVYPNFLRFTDMPASLTNEGLQNGCLGTLQVTYTDEDLIK